MVPDSILTQKGANIKELFERLSWDEQNQLLGIAIGLDMKRQNQQSIRQTAGKEN